jgi:hypothetical protein
MDYVLVLATLVSFALAILWIRQLLGAKSSLPLPPGPKGLPILGNLLDLASDGVHVKCRDWSRQLGMLLFMVVAFRVDRCALLHSRGRHHLT